MQRELKIVKVAAERLVAMEWLLTATLVGSGHEVRVFLIKNILSLDLIR